MWQPSPTFVLHPGKWGRPQPLREFCSPVNNTVALTTRVVFGPQTLNVSAPLSMPAAQPALLARCAFLSWAGSWACSVLALSAVGGVCVQKPLAPAERNYHWSGRSGAVCFEFSFSCQYCYLPTPLTLQCSSGCFKDLNGINWNRKLKYRWVLFTSSSPYNSYSGAKAAAVIFSTSSG